MKKAILLLSCLFTSQVSATLFTFEDIPGGSIQNEFGDMPTYKGFKFSSALDWIDLVDAPLKFGNRGSYSGDFAIFNNEYKKNSIITEENGADFLFGGLWAKAWFTQKNSGGADIISGSLDGYKDGILTWSIPASLNGSYKYYSAQTSLINELRIDFGEKGAFLVDNLALTTISPVPEPNSIALMLGGLGLVGFMAARRTKKV